MRGSVRLISPNVFFVLDSFVILIALVVALCSADSLAVPSSLGAALSTRFTLSNILRAGVVFAAWSSSMRMLHVYRDGFISPLAEAFRIAAAVSTASLVLAASFGKGHMGASSLHISADFAMFCFLALLAFRAAVALLSGSAWSSLLTNRNVLIVGSGPRAIRAYKQIRTDHHRSHTIIGFIDSRANSLTPGEIESLYLGHLANLENILFENVVDEVIIALPARSCYADIEQTIAVCSRVGVEVKYPDDMFPPTSRSARPKPKRHPEMIVIKPAVHDSRLFIKRCFDVAASGLALLLLLPLFLVIAAAIKLTSPGPVFFLQERYGLGRRRFRMCKFRTMVPDAESRLSAIESLNEAQGPIFKIKNDPRVTKVGAFLRRTSLDELPQLLNVLIGHMALVGPRPMSVRDVSRFNAAWLMRRFSVKPGITCLWQVNGRSNTTFDRWIELDLHYIDNWSLSLDAQILALTIPAVVKGSGAM